MYKNPLIWILWGMWPYASLRAYELLLEISKSFSSGTKNQDFPHVLIDSIPVRALIDGAVDEWETITQVHHEFQRLLSSGVNIVLMACNTLHLYREKIYTGYSLDTVNILSLIDETVNHIKTLWYKKVAILWSARTLESWLYTRWLHTSSIETYLPDREMRKSLNQIIDTVISWSSLTSSHKDSMNMLIRECEDQWCECILLGCTELPIAFSDAISTLPFIDPLEVTLTKACELYYRKH